MIPSTVKVTLDKSLSKLKNELQKLIPSILQESIMNAKKHGARDDQVEIAGYAGVIPFIAALTNGVDYDNAYKAAMAGSKSVAEAAKVGKEAAEKCTDPSQKFLVGLETAASIIANSAAKVVPRATKQLEKQISEPTKGVIMMISYKPPPLNNNQISGKGMIGGNAVNTPNGSFDIKWLFGGGNVSSLNPNEVRGGWVGELLSGAVSLAAMTAPIWGPKLFQHFGVSDTSTPPNPYLANSSGNLYTDAQQTYDNIRDATIVRPINNPFEERWSNEDLMKYYWNRNDKLENGQTIASMVDPTKNTPAYVNMERADHFRRMYNRDPNFTQAMAERSAPFYKRPWNAIRNWFTGTDLSAEHEYLDKVDQAALQEMDSVNPYLKNFVNVPWYQNPNFLATVNIIDGVLPWATKLIIDPLSDRALKKHLERGLSENEKNAFLEEARKRGDIIKDEDRYIKEHQSERIADIHARRRKIAHNVVNGVNGVLKLVSVIGGMKNAANVSSYLAHEALKGTKVESWAPFFGGVMGSMYLKQRANSMLGQASALSNATFPFGADYSALGPAVKQVLDPSSMVPIDKGGPDSSESRILAELQKDRDDKLKRRYEKERRKLIEQANAQNSFIPVSSTAPPSFANTSGLPKLLRKDELTAINKQAKKQSLVGYTSGFSSVSPMSSSNVREIPLKMRQSYANLPVMQNPFSYQNMQQLGFQNILDAQQAARKRDDVAMNATLDDYRFMRNQIVNVGQQFGDRIMNDIRSREERKRKKKEKLENRTLEEVIEDHNKEVYMQQMGMKSGKKKKKKGDKLGKHIFGIRRDRDGNPIVFRMDSPLDPQSDIDVQPAYDPSRILSGAYSQSYPSRVDLPDDDDDNYDMPQGNIRLLPYYQALPGIPGQALIPGYH